MTDQEIIQGLIPRDNRVTKEFFFDRCCPLFCGIMKTVFNYEVDYDARQKGTGPCRLEG